MELLSLRAYARKRGVTLRAVQKAIASGRILTIAGPDGKPSIDPEDADRRWDELTDPAKQRGGGPLGLEIARTPEALAAEAEEERAARAKEQAAAEQGDEAPEPEGLPEGWASTVDRFLDSRGEDAEGEPGPRDNITPADFFAARAKKEVYQAKLAKLKFQQLSGQVVPVSEIKDEWQKLISTAKTKLLAVPSKVRSRAPHLTLDDLATIEEEIRAALVELAGSESET